MYCLHQVDDGRLHGASDRIAPHEEALEQHLGSWLGELFVVRWELLLHDVTSTRTAGVPGRHNRRAADSGATTGWFEAS